METAEVINVSVEWFPVQCTLRLTFFDRVRIYMAMPIFAIAIPLLYVYAMSKCTPLLRKQMARKRAAKRKGKTIKGCAKLLFSVVDALSGDSLAKKARTKAARMRDRGAQLTEVETLHGEIDVLLDEIASAELELVDFRRAEEAQRNASEEDVAGAAEESAGHSALDAESRAAAEGAAATKTSASSPAEDALDDATRAAQSADGGRAPLLAPLALLTAAHGGEGAPLFLNEDEDEDAEEDGAAAGCSSRTAPIRVRDRQLRVVDDDDDDDDDEDDAGDDGDADDDSAESVVDTPAIMPSLLAPLPLLAGPGGGESVVIAGDTFYQVVSEVPIALRSAQSHSAAKLPWVVRHGDVVRAERIEQLPGDSGARFLHLSGPWGEGWVPDSLADGTALLLEVDRREMTDPAAAVVERHHRDELRHCFATICAMTPETTSAAASDCVARASIEYVLPAKMNSAKQDAFFASYDADGDGSIDFAEFVAMYPALRKVWRFESAWAEFQHLDESGDGTLEKAELRALVPQGSSEAELGDWMRRFDKGSKGYLTLSDFVAIDGAVRRDMLMLSVGTAFVLTTYFVYSRVTKAILSVFSMEKIEGDLYLKLEVGTPAMNLKHIAMMVLSSIYLLIFSAGVPLVGLLCMFYMRHQHGERRFATMAGFLMDGYRDEVAWFWEFVVLLRKLVILGVSLFIWEPFLQSFAAVVVLVVALSVQLYVQPFQLTALNLLEIASLTSLLAIQLTGVLMWYKQLPENSDNVALYRAGATVLLFAVNGAVIASFVAVTLWYYIKQKSKAIVQWLPCTLPLFEAVVHAEEELRWPNGTDLLISERHDIREDWSYFAALREGRLFGRGAAYAARRKVAKLVAKLEDAMVALAARLRATHEDTEPPARLQPPGAATNRDAAAVEPSREPRQPPICVPTNATAQQDRFNPAFVP